MFDAITNVTSEALKSPANQTAPLMETMEARQLMSVSVDTGTLSISDTSATPAESLSINYSKIEYVYKPTLGHKLTLGHKIV